MKLSRKLNQTYAYQILLELIMQFSILLFTLYNGYIYLMSLNLSEALLDKQIIGLLIWTFLHSTKIIIVNNHCTKFYREVKLYHLQYK